VAQLRQVDHRRAHRHRERRHPRLQAFYRKHYQPDNATLIVAGKFDTAQVLGWVRSTSARCRARSACWHPPTRWTRRRTASARSRAPCGRHPVVYIGYHVPAGSHPDFAAVRVLAQVLGDTPGGRLHKRVVERQLAASTFGFSWALAEPSVLILGGQLAPGQDVARRAPRCWPPSTPWPTNP
jgi:zinc protease